MKSHNLIINNIFNIQKIHHNKNKTISAIEDMGYSVNVVHLYETTYDLEITLNG